MWNAYVEPVKDNINMYGNDMNRFNDQHSNFVSSLLGTDNWLKNMPVSFTYLPLFVKKSFPFCCTYEYREHWESNDFHVELRLSE